MIKGRQQVKDAVMVLLEKQVETAVDDALRKTKGKTNKLADIIEKIGRGSYEHTNFRFFLSHSIAGIINGTPGVGPIEKAWVHSIDVTESDPSACDKAGDGSQCDLTSGSGLPIIVEIGVKGRQQKQLQENLFERLNSAIASTFIKRHIKAGADYLHIDFVTNEEINAKRGPAARITSKYYPPTQVWP